MSRRLNLHLPTSNEFALTRASSENPDRESMKRSSSASSFSSMREKLEKTSKVLQNLGVSNTSTSNNSSEEMTKELQLLRSKVAQLEREKITALVNRSYSEQRVQSLTASLNPSILKLFQSISEKVQNRPQLEDVWMKKFPSEKLLTEKVKQNEHAGLLLKTLEFLDETLSQRNVRKVHSLKSSMSLRKEKIANIYQQISDCMKSTKVCASSLGYSRAESTDYTLNDNIN